MNHVESLIREFRAILEDYEKKSSPIVRNPELEEAITLCRDDLAIFEAEMRKNAADLHVLIPDYLGSGFTLLSLTVPGFTKQRFRDRSNFVLEVYPLFVEQDEELRVRTDNSQSDPALQARVDRVNRWWRLCLSSAQSRRSSLEAPGIPSLEESSNRSDTPWGKRGPKPDPLVEAFKKAILECKADGVADLKEITKRLDQRLELRPYLQKTFAGRSSFQKIPEFRNPKQNLVRRIRNVWPEFKDNPKSRV